MIDSGKTLQFNKVASVGDVLIWSLAMVRHSSRSRKWAMATANQPGGEFHTVFGPNDSLELSTSLDRDTTHARVFKIIVIGDSNVGKTCLTFRFCGGTFLKNPEATIGVDFRERTLELDGETVKVNVRHRVMMRMIVIITASKRVMCSCLYRYCLWTSSVLY